MPVVFGVLAVFLLRHQPGLQRMGQWVLEDAGGDRTDTGQRGCLNNGEQWGTMVDNGEQQ